MFNFNRPPAPPLNPAFTFNWPVVSPQAPVVSNVMPGISTFEPKTDFLKAENELVVLVELPGVEITNCRAEGSTYVIEGNKKNMLPDPKYATGLKHIYTGLFQKRININPHYDITKTQQKYENGLLMLIMPKK